MLSHRQKGALFYGKYEVYRDGCSQGRDLDRGSEFFRQAGDGKHHRNQGEYDSCIDQVGFAKQHPDLAAQGKRSFSLDSYNAPTTLPDGKQTRTEALIKFYWDGEPTYETVRADVLKSLSYKSTVPAPSAKQ